MKIAALRERRPFEARVAITPDAAKRYQSLGLEVAVETGVGLASGYRDEEYTAAGAMVGDARSVANGAQVMLCVQRPLVGDEPRTPIKDATLSLLSSGTVLIGLLSPLEFPDSVHRYAERGITAVAMELIPRISRAQSMDALSSQSNLAGYRAVLDGFAHLAKAAPMLMTAAGTVTPAKVLILGAGVAGLQAIATAKRMGAVVSAFDVRPAAREQVESLGGKFIEVPADANAETAGGYAREMGEDYKRRQAELVAQTIRAQDLVISTALIPGKKAPVLITEEMVRTMQPGSVIVDLAASHGGNCALTKPDEVVDAGGVAILGFTNLPSRVARDASQLYARNLYNLIALLYDKNAHTLVFDRNDPIVAGALLTEGEYVVHPQLAPAATPGQHVLHPVSAPPAMPGVAKEDTGERDTERAMVEIPQDAPEEVKKAVEQAYVLERKAADA